MSKLSKLALALMGVGLLAAPAFAQENEFRIDRGGAEDKPTTSTKLDKVLGWETSDGKFKLKMENRVQFRLTGNNEVANGGSGTNGRDFWNFRVRRFKTTFSGHIFDKDFQYKATIAWTNGAGQLVESATFTWAAHELFNLTGGQDKTPYSWEEMTSSGRQSFVDRSVVNGYFTRVLPRASGPAARSRTTAPYGSSTPPACSMVCCAATATSATRTSPPPATPSRPTQSTSAPATPAAAAWTAT